MEWWVAAAKFVLLSPVCSLRRCIRNRVCRMWGSAGNQHPRHTRFHRRAWLWPACETERVLCWRPVE